jgi:hypothetical protein
MLAIVRSGHFFVNRRRADGRIILLRLRNQPVDGGLFPNLARAAHGSSPSAGFVAVGLGAQPDPKSLHVFCNML